MKQFETDVGKEFKISWNCYYMPPATFKNIMKIILKCLSKKELVIFEYEVRFV